MASVASGYVNLRALDRQLEVARSTANARGASYKIFQDRFAGGVISLLELSQNKSQYEEALATVPQFEKSVAQQENALSALLGRNPGPISRGKNIDNLTAPVAPQGLPSSLLERRPDIREAEQKLIAANAQIGAAKAAYYPSISLTGALGVASGSLSDLFGGASKVWQYGGSLGLPIFTAGLLAGQVQVAEAVQQQALFSYQKAIQDAFRSVDDALIDQDKTRVQLAAQGRQVASLQQYSDTARLRYDNGYTSFLEVAGRRAQPVQRPVELRADPADPAAGLDQPVQGDGRWLDGRGQCADHGGAGEVTVSATVTQRSVTVEPGVQSPVVDDFSTFSRRRMAILSYEIRIFYGLFFAIGLAWCRSIAGTPA